MTGVASTPCTTTEATTVNATVDHSQASGRASVSPVAWAR